MVSEIKAVLNVRTRLVANPYQNFWSGVVLLHLYNIIHSSMNIAIIYQNHFPTWFYSNSCYLTSNYGKINFSKRYVKIMRTFIFSLHERPSKGYAYDESTLNLIQTVEETRILISEYVF